MKSVIRAVTRRLRAIVFINCLILEVRCGRHPAELERWGEAFEVRKNLVGPGGGWTGKWPRFLTGVLPAEHLRAALIEEYPVLAEVLNHPLWAVLRQLENSGSEQDHWVEQIRLYDRPLSWRHFAPLQRRLSTANWQDLVFLLVILASRLPNHRRVREFVQERFVAFIYLVSVQPEFAGAERLLYQVLDHHFCAGHLTPVAVWPDNVEGFARSLRGLRGLPRLAMQILRINDDAAVSVGILCADAEGFNWARLGYGFYWDPEWHRRNLPAKEKRYISPPFVLRFEGPLLENKRLRTRKS